MKIAFSPEWCVTMAALEGDAAIGAGCLFRPDTEPQLPIRVERDPESPGHFRLYDQAGAALSVNGEQLCVALAGDHTRFDTWEEPAAIRDRVNAAGIWELPRLMPGKSAPFAVDSIPLGLAMEDE